MSRQKSMQQIAKEALLEAKQRRAQQEEIQAQESKPMLKAVQKELHGRKGPNPTRYGDWENKGIISDF